MNGDRLKMEHIIMFARGKNVAQDHRPQATFIPRANMMMCSIFIISTAARCSEVCKKSIYEEG